MISSGSKYTGAAALALTNLQSGIFRLQSGRSSRLYMAAGLLVTGHADPEEWFLMINKRRVFRRLEPSKAGTPPLPSSERRRRSISDLGFADSAATEKRLPGRY